MKIYWITKVWPKWQIVIPQEAREDLGINSQDKVVIFSTSWKWIIITSVNELKNHLIKFTDLFDKIK